MDKGLWKSTPEIKAETLQVVLRRGRAHANEVGILLDVQSETVRNRVARGEINAYYVGTRLTVSLEELLRLGVVIPRQSIEAHNLDSNLTNEEDYYDT